MFPNENIALYLLDEDPKIREFAEKFSRIMADKESK